MALDLDALFGGEPTTKAKSEPGRSRRRPKIAQPPPPRQAPERQERTIRQAPHQQAVRERPGGVPPIPRHILGDVELVGYQQLVEKVPHGDVFVDLEDPGDVARAAVQLRGSEPFGDKVVRFGQGRYWVAPGLVSTALLLVDTKHPTSRGWVLGPFERLLRRWYYRRGEQQEPSKHQSRGTMHNYASVHLWRVRHTAVPQARRVAQVREAVERVLLRGRLPTGASYYEGRGSRALDLEALFGQRPLKPPAVFPSGARLRLVRTPPEGWALDRSGPSFTIWRYWPPSRRPSR